MKRGEMQHGVMVDGKFVASGPVVAVQGKEGCRDVRCTRMGAKCVGWHCATCGEPCGSQGHFGCSGAA